MNSQINQEIENSSVNDSYTNEKRLQTLSTILELQQLEKQLFTNLESISTDTSEYSITQQQQITKQINDLSTTRINLFDTLNNLYQFAQNNVSENRRELVDKMTVAKVMEVQLNNMKQMLNELEQIKNNKLRMVQINTYYGKQYQGQTDLMKLIIKVCIVIILLITVSKLDILPHALMNLLIVFTIGVGAFLIFRKISDLASRDNMDFDRYETPVMDAKDLSTSYNYDKNFNEMDIDTWSICGDGTKFDNSKGQCVVKPVEPFSIMNNEVVGYNNELTHISHPMELK
jgi:hypothetical protein